MLKNNYKFIVSLLFSLIFTFTYKAYAFTKYVVYDGNTYRVNYPEVLGDEDDSDKVDDKEQKSNEKERESQKKNNEKAAEAIKKQQERIRETAKKEIERTKSPELKVRADIKQEIKLKRTDSINKDTGDAKELENEREDENENEDEETLLDKRIKVSKESGVKKFEIKREDDGKIEIKAEGFDDTVDSNENEDILNFIPKGETLDKKIKIKAENGKIRLESKSNGTDTKFPLSVDPSTNTLRVQTPAGNVNLVVLPQKAIDNLKEKTDMEEVVTSDIEETNKSEFKGEGAVYKMKAKKNVKFLGLINVPAEFQYEVGTQTGDVVLDSKPWFLTFTGFLFK